MLFAIFNVVNFITNEIGTEILVLHFCLGGLAGLAFVEIIIGLLPQSIYLKINNCKKNCISFIKQSCYISIILDIATSLGKFGWKVHLAEMHCEIV